MNQAVGLATYILKKTTSHFYLVLVLFFSDKSILGLILFERKMTPLVKWFWQMLCYWPKTSSNDWGYGAIRLKEKGRKRAAVVLHLVFAFWHGQNGKIRMRWLNEMTECFVLWRLCRFCPHLRDCLDLSSCLGVQFEERLLVLCRLFICRHLSLGTYALHRLSFRWRDWSSSFIVACLSLLTGFWMIIESGCWSLCLGVEDYILLRLLPPVWGVYQWVIHLAWPWPCTRVVLAW